ncbi:hypothetical protein AB0M39_31175 [Streptomyces sp. NPDC051907]|uniref:hypothetical protein n=1 Tax=Streptomyces sp. NPDC051907 TaxID=3155284 RepID=UPI003414DD22
MADAIRIPVADIISPQGMIVPVERSSPWPLLYIHSGILDFNYPDGAFQGGDQYRSALVTSFIPYADGTLQTWFAEVDPERVAVAACSVAGFRVCKADGSYEFGGVRVDSARVVFERQTHLLNDPVVALLKVGISVRGGNFSRVAYHVTIKSPTPDMNPFDPGGAQPVG